MRQLAPGGGVPLVRRSRQGLGRSRPEMFLVVVTETFQRTAGAVRLQKKANLLAVPVVVLVVVAIAISTWLHPNN